MKIIYKNKLYVVLSVITLIVFIFFIVFTQKNKNISTINPKRGPIVEAIYGIGTVTARQKFQFKVGVPKTVLKLFVHEGDHVQKNDKLIELTDSLTVRSPINGIVDQLPFQPGENVFSDLPVVSVTNLDDSYLVAALDQQGALRVKKGQNVVLNFESLREKKFEGIVESIYPQKGQFMVQVNVKELPKEILPGMTADISIQINKRENAILIPASSINNQSVLIIRENSQIKIPIKIGSMDNEWAEVTSGNIFETDKIVIKK